MKPNLSLRISSLVTIVLMTLHITDDIKRGISKAGAENIGAVAIFTVWLVGVMLLAEKRLGQAIMLLGGLFALAMPIMHFRGANYPDRVASVNGFFFAWVLVVVGTLGAFVAILAIQEL